ncbi:hypothetical protein CRE_08455 [Caenorhabditis remanei]|uniref:HTH CENPB-type domain-containing protein n=1 Tax=Caenorhabditis remanei TaxID=31234 RepID=E3N000_CAERE|nr:hypothetical protein CRE_08455 [Caenorhabditis remanei]
MFRVGILSIFIIFMSLNVSHILYILSQTFPLPVPKNPNLSRQERNLANHIINIIKEAETGEVEIEETEELVDEDYDGDYEVEAFKPHDDFVLPSHQHLAFGDKTVSREEAQKAIDFYRKTTKGTRPFKTMKSRFRWITNLGHLEKLRRYEKEKTDFNESRSNLLRVLSKRLFQEVKEKLDEGKNYLVPSIILENFQTGLHLHDRDLQTMARKINRSETKVTNFLASQTWISKWKNSHRYPNIKNLNIFNQTFSIVSRRITKFVTRRCLRNKDEIRKTGDDFLKMVRQEIKNLCPSVVFNSDQTGIQKELYSQRSLAFCNEKQVERLVQSKASLTHSFTFMPMLFMNGTLGPKAYLLMAEPTGEFPRTRPIPDVPNLVVRAAKSHIMTKEHMRDWIRTCVFDVNLPKKMYMLVDSWSSFKDHKSIQECVPRGHELTVRNIPPNTTGFLQPLDVYFNGPWKNLIKKFTAHTLNFHPDYLIANRNNEILMVALLYHQISALHFQDFLKYPWRKAGFMDKEVSPSPFQTPSEYCFGPEVSNENCYINGCSEMSFILCSRCKFYICFDHFCISLNHFCPVA